MILLSTYVIFLFYNFCNGNIVKNIVNRKNETFLKRSIESINLKKNNYLQCYSYVHGFSNSNDSDLQKVQCNVINDKCIQANSSINDVEKSWLGCASDYCKFTNTPYNSSRFVDGCKSNLIIYNGISNYNILCSCSYDLCNKNGSNRSISTSLLHLVSGFLIFILQALFMKKY